MKFFTAALLTSLTACPMASALGINCRGSSNCGVGYPSDTMQQLLNQVAGMDPRFTYRSDGRHITCVKNVRRHYATHYYGTHLERSVTHLYTLSGMRFPTGHYRRRQELVSNPSIPAGFDQPWLQGA